MKRLLVILVGSLALLSASVWFYFATLMLKPFQQPIAQEKSKLNITSEQEFGLPDPVKVTLPGDGIQMQGYWFQNSAETACAALLLHGHTSSRYGVYKYAPLFWNQGCHLLIPDLRAHGESTGDHVTYGYREKHDVVTAVSWLMEKTGFQQEQIALLGESLGAATALQAAVLLPDLGMVVSDSSFSAVGDIMSWQAQERFGPLARFFVPPALLIADQLGDMKSAATSPAIAAGNVRAPVFMVHSKQDSFTPYDHAGKIYEKISHDNKALLTSDWGAGHGQSITTNPKAYMESFQAFLKEQQFAQFTINADVKRF